MDAINEWRLLCTIAPQFLELATFFVGSSDQATKARAKLDLAEGDRDPFYAKLKAHLEELVCFIQEWEEESIISDTQQAAIQQVLHAFETRCSIISRRQKKANTKLPIGKQPKLYENLYNLSGKIQERNDQGKDLKIGELLTLIKLTGKRKQTRDEIITRLGNCNETLRTTTSAARQEANLESDLPDTMYRSRTIPKNAQLYSDKRRQVMNRIYELLVLHWRENELDKPDAHLLLNPHSEPGGNIDAQLDFWFFIKTQGSKIQWQHADLLAYREEKNIKGPNVYQTYTGRSQDKKIEPSGHENCGPWDFKDDGFDFEGLIWHVAQLDPPMSLNLVIKDNTLKWENRTTTSVLKSEIQDFLSFQSMIAEGYSSKLGQQSLKSRFILAFFIASSFLQMCGGPWSRTWSWKQQISFASSTNSVDISQPCLATRFTYAPKKETAAEILKKKTRRHDYPDILALGFMLIQIFLGKPIEAYRTSDNPNSKDPSRYEIDADITVAKRMFESPEWRQYNNEWYDQAVKACLDSLHFTKGRSLNDEKFREQIYKDIVWRIELVAIAHGYSPSGKSPWQNLFNAPVPNYALVSSEQLKGNKVAKNFVATSQARMETSEIVTETKDVFNSILLTSKLGQPADDWIKDIEKNIHPLLRRTADEKPFENQLLRNPDGVRIAIIDTGVDLSKSAKLKAGDRIERFKDWVDGGREGEPWVDNEGHGTHAAGLLLEIAPTANIYVARVFDKAKNGAVKVVPQMIADAIMWAVDTWIVDIISMSFELEENGDKVEDAVLHAYSKKVIMSAAAGNSGGNAHPPSPGNLNEVIAIHASDALGNPAPFTANPNLNGCNFMLPGVDINSTWSASLKEQGLNMRTSGTSNSAPIAAALAANLLEIAGLELFRSQKIQDIDSQTVKQWRKLKSMNGMCKAFSKMSVKRGGSDRYDYVQPQLFFGRYKIQTAMEILLAELK